jgi:hypothetical protein
MTEDRGAFKTNPRNPARFQLFVTDRKHRCNPAAPVEKTLSRIRTGVLTADI